MTKRKKPGYCNATHPKCAPAFTAGADIELVVQPQRRRFASPNRNIRFGTMQEFLPSTTPPEHVSFRLQLEDESFAATERPCALPPRLCREDAENVSLFVADDGYDGVVGGAGAHIFK